MTTKAVMAATLSASLLFSACAKMNNTTKGGAIGAGTGGAIGGIIGNRTGNTAGGILIGAAVGGAAGALIGRKMDKQAEELQRDLKNARVERVGEGIKITFDSGILFAVNSADLSAGSKSNLTQMAATLKKYPDTNIMVDGHTDADGTDALNQGLSERRAASVGSFLQSQGVANSRVSTRGFGESQPVADNGTASGKQANRRVEVAIWANDKMKKAAEKGQLD